MYVQDVVKETFDPVRAVVLGAIYPALSFTTNVFALKDKRLATSPYSKSESLEAISFSSCLSFRVLF
jgi:hypothetical protein